MRTKATPKTIDNGKAAQPMVVPEWKLCLNSYLRKQLLRFVSKTDLHAAIDLLWTDSFRTLPHATPDGRSIVVPDEAVEHLARAGLKFMARRLRSMSELSPAEIKNLRR